MPSGGQMSVSEWEARAHGVRATLSRMRGVSSSVLDILSSMDAKFGELEATMRPIQSRTQALTRVHDNLEAACQVAGDILHKFDKPQQLRPKLERGLGATPTPASLRAYLARVAELQEAIAYLETIQHFQSAEAVLRDARALLAICTQHLEEAFRAELQSPRLEEELLSSQRRAQGAGGRGGGEHVLAGDAAAPGGGGGSGSGSSSSHTNAAAVTPVAVLATARSSLARSSGGSAALEAANAELLAQLSSLSAEQPRPRPQRARAENGDGADDDGDDDDVAAVEGEAVPRLRALAGALVRLGPGPAKRCVALYVAARSAAVEDAMEALGAEALRNPESAAGGAGIGDGGGGAGAVVDWEALQQRITLWLRFSVVVVRTLFVRELTLAASVFVVDKEEERAQPSQEPPQAAAAVAAASQMMRVDHQRMEGLAARAFEGSVGPCMSLLQGFAQAVALGRLMPEKVFALLHMIDTVEELMLELQRAAASLRQRRRRHHGGTANIKVLTAHMRQLLQTLVEGAREIFEELEEAVRKDTSKHVVPNGSVHPLTSYVFNYVRRLLEYDSAFRALFSGPGDGDAKRRRRQRERRRHGADDDDDDDEEEDLAPEDLQDDEDGDEDEDEGGDGERAAALHGLWPGRARSDAQLVREERRAAVAVGALFDALRGNLEGKARSQYPKSVAQQHFFLMNNLHYVVHSVAQYELLPLLGERWGRGFESAAEAEAQTFVEATWGKLAGQLRSAEHSVGGSATAGAAVSKLPKAQRHAVKDAFRAFNAELMEAIAQQTGWAVTDDSLRARVRALVVAALVEPYRHFHALAQRLPFTKNPHKYFKYTPDEVQQMTTALFHA
eukprot:scaffold1457_cov350-Prasinococcus_capsulatus_cf.AAC.5